MPPIDWTPRPCAPPLEHGAAPPPGSGRPGPPAAPLPAIAPVITLGLTLGLTLVLGLAALAPTRALAAAPEVHALTGVRIVVAPGRVVEQGTVVLRDGIVEAAGADVEIPPDARIWERDGLTVYPGLVEPYSTRPWPEGEGEATDPGAHGAYPNPAVRAEREMGTHAADPSADRRLREAGYTVAVLAPREGVLRGRSVLVSLGEGPVGERILVPRLAQNVHLESSAPDGYPQSLMGSVALTRQTFLDAAWYRDAWQAYRRNPAQRRPRFDAALEALAPVAAGDEPVVFESDDLLGVLRSARLAEERDLVAWLVASGEEYLRPELVSGLAAGGEPGERPLLVPLDFPEAPEGSGDRLSIELADLRHWKNAPTNPAVLIAAGVPVAFTSHRLDRPSEIHARVTRAIEAGLSPEDALAALTTEPARILGVADRLGTVEAGKIANLTVVDGELFTAGAADLGRIQEVWIDGRRYEVRETAPPEVEPAGTWELAIDAGGETITARLVLEGMAPSLTGTLSAQGAEVTLDGAEVSGSTLEITFDGAGFGMPGPFTVRLDISEDRADGSGDGPPGPFTLTAVRVSGPPESLTGEEVVR